MKELKIKIIYFLTINNLTLGANHCQVSTFDLILRIFFIDSS